MRALVLLLVVALAAGAAATAALPSCCHNVQGVYDDTVANFTAGMSVSLSCANCGANVTTLGVFAQLTTFSGGSLSIACTNCSGLTMLGVFAQLPAVTGGSLQLACTNCSALATMGQFANLLQVTVFASNYFQITILCNMSFACTDCPALTTFVDAPVLSTLRIGNTAPLAMGFNMSIVCVRCAALPTLVVWPQLTFLGSSDTILTLTITCTDCAALTDMVHLAGLANAFTEDSSVLEVVCTDCSALQRLWTTEQLSNLGTGVGTVSQLACVNCPQLTSLCNFGALNDLNAGSMLVSCTNCSSLQTFSAFDTLTNVGLSTLVTVTLACTDCPRLVSMGNFSQLASLTTGPDVNVTVSCIDCPLLTTLALFPALASLSNDNAYLNTITTATYLSVACTNCAALVQAASFPVLTAFCNSLQATTCVAGISVACTECPLVTNLATFAVLTTFYVGAATQASIQLFCTGCPLIASVQPTSFPAIAISSTQLANISLTCDACAATFSFVFPIVYGFTGSSLPTAYGTLNDGAGLVLADAQPSAASLAAMGALVAVRRLRLLTLANVTGLVNVDMLAALERIDGALTVQGCAQLGNMDGLTASLQTVGFVTIQNNAALCNIDTAKLAVVSQTNPVVVANGPALASDCPVLEPAALSDLHLQAISTSSIQLTWTQVAQPSVAVMYSLTMNGVVVLSYPAWNRPTVPYLLTALTPSTTYTLVLSATLGGATRFSSPFAVTTLAGAPAQCPAGQVGPLNNCTTCIAGTFVSLDGTTCVNCPAGTFSNTPGISSSSGCQLCAAGTYAPLSGLTQCSPCPSASTCVLGAATALPASIAAVSATTSVVSSAASTPAASSSSSAAGAFGTQAPSTPSSLSGLSPGYVFLIVFFALSAALTVLVLLTRKFSHHIVTKFAALMRTPRWLLSVDTSSARWRLVEPPSLVRGLIGLYVTLGVVLVTVYQIYNFAINQYAISSSLQPGTAFSDGTAITSALTQLTAVLVLYASPVTCDQTLFTVTAALGDDVLPHSTIACAVSPDGTSTTVSVSTPAGQGLVLTTASLALFSVTIASTSGNVVYAPALQYAFMGLRYDGASVVVNETIVGTATTVLTGTTSVVVAAVAAEQQTIDGKIRRTGYSFSYISTTAGTAASSALSTDLAVTFQLNVPAYYLLVQQIQNISAIAFISGLLAIAAGIVAFGTFSAFYISLALHVRRIREDRANSTPVTELQMERTAKPDF